MAVSENFAKAADYSAVTLFPDTLVTQDGQRLQIAASVRCILNDLKRELSVIKNGDYGHNQPAKNDAYWLAILPVLDAAKNLNNTAASLNPPGFSEELHVEQSVDGNDVLEVVNMRAIEKDLVSAVNQWLEVIRYDNDVIFKEMPLPLCVNSDGRIGQKVKATTDVLSFQDDSGAYKWADRLSNQDVIAHHSQELDSKHSYAISLD